MKLFICNSAMPTTVGRGLVSTGTAIKTMLQLKGLCDLKVCEWGISFPAFVDAAKPLVELLTTGTVFATVTALAEADITKIGNSTSLAAEILTLGTSSSGFTASAEGSIVATAALDGPAQLSPTGYFSKWFPLDDEPIIYKGESGRIRVTSAVAYNVSCWLRVKPA